MTPENKARHAIDKKLSTIGYVVQDMQNMNLATAFEYIGCLIFSAGAWKNTFSCNKSQPSLLWMKSTPAHW